MGKNNLKRLPQIMKHKKDEIQEVESCTKHCVNYLTREKPLLQCL